VYNEKWSLQPLADVAINSLSVVFGSYIIATVGWQFLKVRSMKIKYMIPREEYKLIEKYIYIIYRANLLSFHRV